MKLFIYILSWGFPYIVFSQNNLVPNNSFEEYSDCPSADNQLYLTLYWYTPTLGSNIYFAEYYNVCGTNGRGIPTNVCGNEDAYDGKAYIGFYTYYNIYSTCEYVQIELSDTLKSNKGYYLEFYISLADNSGLATTHIGAYISDTAVWNSNYNPFPYTPQIISNTLAQVTNKNGWSKISGTYTAHGGEKFLTLGNFNPNPYADTIIVGGPWNCCAYYYFDNVYVGLDTTTNIKEQKVFDFSFTVYPNPAQDYVQVETENSTQSELFVYNMQGSLLLQKSFTGSTSIKIKTWTAGVYCVKVITDKAISMKRFVKG